MRAQLLSVARSPAQACMSWTLATIRSDIVPMSFILYASAVMQIVMVLLGMALSSRMSFHAQ